MIAHDGRGMRVAEEAMATMQRRSFVAGMAAVVADLTVVAAPRAETLRRIGYLASAPRTRITDSFWDAFVAGLHEHGWIESQNILIERRYIEMQQQAALAAAEELLRLKVEVIVVSTTQAALAAKQATRTTPIVMTVPSDPVRVGLVGSLARPGGNVTGLSFVGTELAGKQVELLKEAVPGLDRYPAQSAERFPRAACQRNGGRRACARIAGGGRAGEVP
jgi:putative ABC transport system substrate-binding protein